MNYPPAAGQGLRFSAAHAYHVSVFAQVSSTLCRYSKLTNKYEGCFISMDILKKKQVIDDMYNNGDAPWKVWKYE